MGNLILNIILSDPPAGVAFCVQQGHGNDVLPHQKQVAGHGDLKFFFSVTLKTAKDGDLDFGGPFVQGPVGSRFIYISVGALAGDINSPWQRRMKIPLTGINPGMIAEPGTTLTTTVPGKGKDGTPNCATIKPFAGWKTEPA